MLIVPFRTAVAGLSPYMSFNLDTAKATLQRITAIADLARVYRELKKPMPRIKITISYTNGVDLEQVEENIIGLLDKLFPIDEDIMIANQMEDGGLFSDMGECVIVPAFIGWETNWDEIEEAVSGALEYHDGMSVPIFIGACQNNFNEETWEVFNKHFKWGVECPDGEFGDLNYRKLYKIIEERKQIKFDVDFIRATLMDTGLCFFDFNPYDDDAWNYHHFRWSYENILQMAEEWKKAKVIRDRVGYNYKVSQDPKQMKLLLQALKDAQRK
jgi:hypothetical protein